MLKVWHERVEKDKDNDVQTDIARISPFIYWLFCSSNYFMFYNICYLRYITKYVIVFYHEFFELFSLIRRQLWCRKARDRKLEVGQKVLILLPTHTSKLLASWKGPFVVTDKVSPWTSSTLSFLCNAVEIARFISLSSVPSSVLRPEITFKHAAISVCNRQS
jgi:hypothetical protein